MPQSLTLSAVPASRQQRRITQIGRYSESSTRNSSTSRTSGSQTMGHWHGGRNGGRRGGVDGEQGVCARLREGARRGTWYRSAGTCTVKAVGHRSEASIPVSLVAEAGEFGSGTGRGPPTSQYLVETESREDRYHLPRQETRSRLAASRVLGETSRSSDADRTG